MSKQLTKTYELAFPVATVYRAWVSSETVIPPATAMDVLPEVGGHYRLRIDLPDFKGRNDGVFSAVVPEEHLRYSWEWNSDGEVTEVDVRFAVSAVGCRIELRHSGFQDDASLERHALGWDSYIEGFEVHLRTKNA